MEEEKVTSMGDCLILSAVYWKCKKTVIKIDRNSDIILRKSQKKTILQLQFASLTN